MIKDEINIAAIETSGRKPLIKYDINHIGVNALTDGCFLSSIAGAIFVWHVPSPASDVVFGMTTNDFVLGASLVAIPACLIIRCIGEAQKDRKLLRENIDQIFLNDPVPLTPTIQPEEQTKSLLKQFITFKAPLLVQPAFQLAVVLATAPPAIQSFLATQDLGELRKFAVFSLNLTGNLVAFFEKPTSQLLARPWMYWGAAFTLMGNIHDPANKLQVALSTVSIVSYVLATLQPYMASVLAPLRLEEAKTDATTKEPSGMLTNAFRAVGKILTQEVFAPLLLATGCAAAVVQNIVQQDIWSATVVGLYGVTCVSLYLTQRYRGVAEFVEHIEKKAFRPNNQNSKPSEADLKL